MIPLFRSKLFLTGVVVALLLVGMGVGRVVLRNRALAQEVATLEAEAAALQSRNATLGELMKRFDTQAFLEHEARVKLNLQKPGERVVAFRSGEPTSTTPAQITHTAPSTFALWWEYFFPTQTAAGL